MTQPHIEALRKLSADRGVRGEADGLLATFKDRQRQVDKATYDAMEARYSAPTDNMEARYGAPTDKT